MTIKNIFKMLFSFKYLLVIIISVIFIRFFNAVFGGFLLGFATAIFMMLMFLGDIE